MSSSTSIRDLDCHRSFECRHRLFAGGGVRGGWSSGPKRPTAPSSTIPVGPRIGQSWLRTLPPLFIPHSASDYTTTRRDDPLGRGFEYVPSNTGFHISPLREL